MNKRILLSCMMAAASIAASAQNLAGTSLDDRIGHGQDSINARRNISGYMSFIKSQSYKDAYEPWKEVITKVPLAQVRTYKDGQFLLQTLISQEQDPTLKQQYFDDLMNLYDTRLSNMEALNSFAGAKDQSTKGGIICRKAYDSYFFNPKPDVVKSYALFKEGIGEAGNDTEGFVLYGFIQLSEARFKANNDKYREDFVNDYLLVTEICDRLLKQANEYETTIVPADTTSENPEDWQERVILDPAAEKIIQAYQPPFDQAEALFVASGAADCEALDKIYAPKVEANKSDLSYLNSVLQVLSNFQCDNSATYYLASDYAYQINKTPQAAIGKATKLLKDGDDDGAIKYFDEAIGLESDNAKKAKYSYIVAALMFKKGNTAKCREYCRKTLQYDPHKGDAYLLQATCIVRMASGDHLQKSYYYCLASDYCNRAKQADPSCSAKASKQAAGYSAGFYPKSEAFFAGLRAGQAVSVLGESTTLRLR